MHVVLAVRNDQPQLVQSRGTAQYLRVVAIQLPGFADLVEQAAGGGFHALRLYFVDAVALHQRGHRTVARVVFAAAAKHVVQDAFAHRRLADHQFLQPQRLERSFQHQDATGDDGPPFGGQTEQLDVFDALGLEQLLAQRRQRLRRDRPLVSFIAAHISPMALCVPDEPIASCQPSALYWPANCWNSAPISVSASFHFFFDNLPPGKTAACWQCIRPADSRVPASETRGR